ncbi:hypothetical protein RvY_06733 [Ramazzottius varieornatus]|uniref:Secreted protein n=1 Tax=Ramazzottius varieornatus TaxID=947166 RepID=A0A1D1V4Z9_RAMVA|nr:hypothetical protein RvY_06733 [Ramazzottius varieornatus]
MGLRCLLCLFVNLEKKSVLQAAAQNVPNGNDGMVALICIVSKARQEHTRTFQFHWLNQLWNRDDWLAQTRK